MVLLVYPSLAAVVVEKSSCSAHVVANKTAAAAAFSALPYPFFLNLATSSRLFLHMFSLLHLC